MKRHTARSVDLINGPIIPGILRFALPIFLGQLLQQLYNLADAWVVGNFADNNAYWAQFEDQVIAQVSETVNDAYLKANNQQDGTQSYGRMVDLLLADFRQRHGLE